MNLAHGTHHKLHCISANKLKLTRYPYIWKGWQSMMVQHSSTHHDDVIKWNHFSRHWPFVRGIHRSPVNSPHKGQWRGTFMFSLICGRINGWVNSDEAGDLRRHWANYDIIVINNRMYSDENTFARCRLSAGYVEGWWCCVSVTGDQIRGKNQRDTKCPTKQQTMSQLHDNGYMNHFVNSPSQWEMTLQCNVVSHWLGTFTKLSRRILQEIQREPLIHDLTLNNG